MHTLIVEDEFTSRVLLLRFLADFGAVDVAVDGIEAVVAFEAALTSGTRYDLVLLDIGLPRMDGLEVLGKFRELEEKHQAPNTVVLMTTARRDGKTVMRSFFKGCEGYLCKPIHRDEVVAKLAEHGLIDPTLAEAK